MPSGSSTRSQRGCDPALDRDTDVINPEVSNQHTEEQLCNSCTIANDQSVGRFNVAKVTTLKKLVQNDPAFSTAANILGMLYISRKRSVTNPEGTNQHSEEDIRQSGGHPTTAEIVARETGVSPRTIANDAAYAEAAS
jgi:hypothetical protein